MPRGPAQKFPKTALKQLRSDVLRQFDSLHGAFEILSRGVSPDKALGPKELRASLALIGPSTSDDFFRAVGTAWPGAVSLAQLFRALLEVAACPEAFLWELRDCLTRSGVALGRTAEAIASTRDLLETASTDRSSQDWLTLCGILGLTLFEARRLLKIVGNEAGAVSLERTFKLLRGLVAPEYSLQAFVVKILEQYDSLCNAFRSVTLHRTREPTMQLRDFCRLASILGVKASEALDLWVTLLSGTEGKRLVPDGGKGCGSLEAREAVSLSEKDFVARMAEWAPDDVMSKLKGQLCERFGGLGEGRTALVNQGLAGRSALTPRRFSAGLRAVGVASCSAEVVLHTVRKLLNRPFYYQVTLDDVIEKMRSSHTSSGTAHDIVGGDILHVWQQLHAVKAAVRQRADGEDSTRASSKDSSCNTSCQSSTPSTSDGLETAPCFEERHHSTASMNWADLLCTSDSRGGGLCRSASACSSRSSSKASSEVSLTRRRSSELRRPPEDLTRWRRCSRPKP